LDKLSDNEPNYLQIVIELIFDPLKVNLIKEDFGLTEAYIVLFKEILNS
jgi:hypothetical protein